MATCGVDGRAGRNVTVAGLGVKEGTNEKQYCLDEAHRENEGS
jgi:hypothetical protein